MFATRFVQSFYLAVEFALWQLLVKIPFLTSLVFPVIFIYYSTLLAHITAHHPHVRDEIIWIVLQYKIISLSKREFKCTIILFGGEDKVTVNCQEGCQRYSGNFYLVLS